MLRFNIRNLLIGTTWFFIWGTLILNRREIEDASPLYSVPLLASFFVLPFVAVGSFFGRALEAVIVAFFLIWLGLAFASLFS